MPVPGFLWPPVRFAMRSYWRIRRPLTMGVRAAVLDAEGRVLLVRHTYMPGWFLPGGGIERRETARDALVRELDEEVGVTLAGDPEFVGLYANFREFKSDHVALFAVRAFTMAPRRSSEIAAFDFFAPDALPDETSGGTRRRIREVLHGLPPAERW